jgi:CubicO group peptidase (beta-lactamase class C family)
MRKITFLLLFVTSHLLAQTNLKKIQSFLPKVDSMFMDQARKSHMPGLVYGIMYQGKLIHSKALGEAQLETKFSAAQDIDFRIASMSKSFASMAILQLRDAGKLRLDDPAELYIPELKQSKSLTKSPFDI